MCLSFAEQATSPRQLERQRVGPGCMTAPRRLPRPLQREDTVSSRPEPASRARRLTLPPGLGPGGCASAARGPGSLVSPEPAPGPGAPAPHRGERPSQPVPSCSLCAELRGRVLRVPRGRTSKERDRSDSHRHHWLGPGPRRAACPGAKRAGVAGRTCQDQLPGRPLGTQAPGNPVSGGSFFLQSGGLWDFPSNNGRIVRVAGTQKRRGAPWTQVCSSGDRASASRPVGPHPEFGHSVPARALPGARPP